MVSSKFLLSELGLRGFRLSEPSKGHPTLGILAFETARAMSLLVSLYKSHSDSEIRGLRLFVLRSEGIRYLNSSDEGFLLNLACSERIEDLDRVAFVVSRLGKKCQAAELQGFDRIYDDLKVGSVDMLRLGFPEKKIDRKIRKIEKLVSATSELYNSLEVLNEMEASEQKMQRWKSYSGPISSEAKTDPDQFRQKLALQKRHVRRVRAESLWNLPFEKVVPLMARLVCNVFARICIVFGPYALDLPQILSNGNVIFVASVQRQREREPRETERSLPACYASGPLERFVAKDMTIRNSGPILQERRSELDIFRSRKPKQNSSSGLWLGFGSDDKRRINGKRNPVAKEASRTTVGGSALATRYASLIVLAEKLLKCPDLVDEGTREELYQMLPSGVRTAVNTRLRSLMRCEGLGPSDADEWKDALERMLAWLGPMAHNMLRWEAERTYEQQRQDMRPTVLLVQTLYFSDREKTEAAIVELLVGLSCVCRYVDRQYSSPSLSQLLYHKADC